MSDYQKIANLIANYSRIYDSGDFEHYAELFRHGTVGGPTGTFETMDDIVAYHSKNCILYDGKPNTAHIISNLKIEVTEGDDMASSECYVVIYSAAAGFPLQPVFVGSYLDTFHRIDGIWWFKNRRCIAHLVGDLSAHAREFVPATHLSTA